MILGSARPATQFGWPIEAFESSMSDAFWFESHLISIVIESGVLHILVETAHEGRYRFSCTSLGSVSLDFSSEAQMGEPEEVIDVLHGDARKVEGLRPFAVLTNKSTLNFTAGSMSVETEDS